MIDTVLDPEKFGWLCRSSAVTRLHLGAELLVSVLELGLSPQQTPDASEHEQLDRLEAHYSACSRELADAGLKTSPDDAAQYVAQRAEWEQRVLSVGPVLGYSIVDVTATH